MRRREGDGGGGRSGRPRRAFRRPRQAELPVRGVNRGVRPRREARGGGDGGAVRVAGARRAIEVGAQRRGVFDEGGVRLRERDDAPGALAEAPGAVPRVESRAAPARRRGRTRTASAPPRRRSGWCSPGDACATRGGGRASRATPRASPRASSGGARGAERARGRARRTRGSEERAGDDGGGGTPRRGSRRASSARARARVARAAGTIRAFPRNARDPGAPGDREPFPRRSRSRARPRVANRETRRGRGDGTILGASEEKVGRRGVRGTERAKTRAFFYQYNDDKRGA